jgi:hypothetical protein
MVDMPQEAALVLAALAQSDLLLDEHSQDFVYMNAQGLEVYQGGE